MNILGGTPVGKRPFRNVSVNESNIQMDLKEIRCECVDWIHLAQVGSSDGLLKTPK
jgi:hypothetical protein